MMRLFVIVLTMAFGVSAYAAPKKGAADDVSPGGSDGCGLGWQVTDKKTMSATTTRGTTNGVVPATFGMTSGTLGCEQHPFVKAEMDAVQYAHNNYENLSIDMAKGQGEYVTAFAEAMGCSDTASVARLTQTNYPKVSQAKNGVALYENVRELIRQDSALSQTCTKTI